MTMTSKNLLSEDIEMKFRLHVRKQNYKSIKEELLEHGISVDEEAELILSEAENEESTIICKDGEESILVALDDMIFAESLGHEIWIHTKNQKYRFMNPLYQLEKNLPVGKFLRISKSVIINTQKVKSIKSGLSQKFMVTLENGEMVDVTRTYYYEFKCAFRI